MSIRVGMRAMGRVVGPVAPPPWPPEPIEYVFTEGTASPYNVKYDDIDGTGPFAVVTSEHATATGFCTARKLVRMRDGTLYEVYLRQLAGKYQIYVKKSVNDGATWTDETRISTYAGMEDYNHLLPSIAVDSMDYLHVVWIGMATGYTTVYQIWYRKYTTSWGTVARISTYAGMEDYHQFYPVIAVDSSDYLHVVWFGSATGYTTAAQIWYRKYTTSWGTVARISTYGNMGTNAQSTACIAVDSSDHLHVVWGGKATGYTTFDQIWYVKYTTSWGTVTRISTGVNMQLYGQYQPVIAVDSSDYLHVVWRGNAPADPGHFQIIYTKYTTSWGVPVRISTRTGMEDYQHLGPSIAVDSDDYLHVVWYGMAPGYTDETKIWYAEYIISWANPVVLQPTGRSRWPNLRWSRWP